MMRLTAGQGRHKAEVSFSSVTPQYSGERTNQDDTPEGK